MRLWCRSRRYLVARSRVRCAVVGLLLLNWVLLTAGIPLPLPTAKDRSQPFPCMDSQCGCRSAAACWKSCCCHTEIEKILWARRHGVTPPAFVLAAAKREATEFMESQCASTAKKSCCQKSRSQNSQRSCCPKEESNDAVLTNLAQSLAKDSTEESSGQETEFDTVMLSSLLQCQGNVISALLDMAGLPAVDQSEFPCGDLLSQWLTLLDQQALEVAYLPPVPPPQAAF